MAGGGHDDVRATLAELERKLKDLERELQQAAGEPPGPPAPPPEDDAPVSGQITVDAGPFADIATLSAFQQALARVPGAQDVYVRGFEGDRAIIDVRLASAVVLGAALRESAPMELRLTHEGPGQVRVTVGG